MKTIGTISLISFLFVLILWSCQKDHGQSNLFGKTRWENIIRKRNIDSNGNSYENRSTFEYNEFNYPMVETVTSPGGIPKVYEYVYHDCQ